MTCCHAAQRPYFRSAEGQPQPAKLEPTKHSSLFFTKRVPVRPPLLSDSRVVSPICAAVILATPLLEQRLASELPGMRGLNLADQLGLRTWFDRKFVQPRWVDSCT